MKLHGYCDGSGNSPKGSTAGAVLIEEATGIILAERSRVLPLCSNNIAEYEGVILVIESAIELGVVDLKIHSDSQLIVNQTNGSWKVKDKKLRSLREKVWELASEIPGDLEICWVRREKNHRADHLCRIALKSFHRGEREVGSVEIH